jgi:hypothetical protein
VLPNDTVSKESDKKENAGISGAYSLRMKAEMVLFAVFYSSIETLPLHTSGKVIRCETLHTEGHL